LCAVAERLDRRQPIRGKFKHVRHARGGLAHSVLSRATPSNVFAFGQALEMLKKRLPAGR